MFNNRFSITFTLARAMAPIMAERAFLAIQWKIFNHCYIRAINYHDTPAGTAHNFEKHLQFYRQHFSPVSLSDLNRFFESKEWWKDKPGLIISFDDGHRNNYDVAAPLLEKYGFTGWFFVPVDYINTPPKEQKEFASKHNFAPLNSQTWQEGYEDGRVALSWDELRELDKKHVIGCHTRSHHRMFASTSPEQLNNEIIEAKHILEQELQHSIDIFCWCGGEKNTYSSEAARYVRRAGYRYSFMTISAPILPSTDRLQLHRTNVESHMHINNVKFWLTGLMDVLYTPKRRQVNRITVNTA